MGYLFTARPVDPDRPLVALLNGRMAQHGMPWREDDPAWSKVPVWARDSVIEEALVDLGYSLNAPDHVPAGGCRGLPINDEFAAPLQITVRR